MSSRLEDERLFRQAQEAKFAAARASERGPRDGGKLPAPPVGRGWQDLLATGLLAGQALNADAAANAQRILASAGGFNVMDAAREHQQMAFKSVLEPPAAGAAAFAGKADVSAFLADMHACARTAALSESATTAVAHLQAHQAAQALSEWEAAKESLLADLGLVVPLAASAAANADAEAAGNLQHQRAVASGLSATAAAGGAASAAAQQQAQPFGTGAGDLVSPSALPPADPSAALYADALRRMACVCAAAAVDGPAAGVPAVLHDQMGPVAALERVSGGAADTSPRHRLWLALAAIAREADLGAAFAGGHAGGQPFLGAFRDQARSSAVGTAQEISHAVAGGGARLLPLDRAATMGPSLRLQWAAGSLAHLQAVRLAELEARVAASAAAGGGGAALPAPQGAGDSALLAAVRRAVWADVVEFQRNHPGSAAAAGGLGLGMRGLLAGGAGADPAAAGGLYPAWFEAGQATGLATPYGSVSLPLFPQLYHLLCCGGYSEALSLLAQVQARLPPASPFHELAAALHQALLAFAHVVHAIGTADPRAGILDAARAAAAAQANHPATRRALQGVIGRWYAQSCGVRERQTEGGGRFRGGEEEGGPEELLLSDGYCQAVLRLLCFGADPEAPRHLGLSAGPDYWFLRLWYAAAAPLSVAIGGRDAFAFDIFTAGEVFTEGVEEEAGGEGGAAAAGGGERRDAEDVLDPDGSQAYACAEHLLLCGFPERAVAHLVGRGQAAGPECLHDAVHLGLALHYLGLLHTLPSAEAIQRHNDLFSAAIKPGPRGPDDRVVVAVATEPDPESDTRYANSLFYVTLTYKRPRPGHSTADLASWEPLGEEEGEPELTLHALDLASLVASYVDYCLPGRPEPAADYVSVACYDDPEQQGLQLAGLLAQSRAFDTLAGPLAVVGGAFASSIPGSYLATHGLVSPAGLPQQLRPDRHLQSVVMEAGHMCEVQGRLQDALALYLRLPYPGLGLDAALPILLRELAQLADLPWRDPAAAGALLGSTASFKALADRSLLKEIAASVCRLPPAGRALGHADTAAALADAQRSGQLAALQQLLLQCELYEQLAVGDVGRALEALEGSELLPRPESGQAGWAAAFDKLPEPLKAGYGDFLLAAAEALARYAQALAEGGAGRDPATRRQLREVRERVKSFGRRREHTSLMQRHLRDDVIRTLQAVEQRLPPE